MSTPTYIFTSHSAVTGNLGQTAMSADASIIYVVMATSIVYKNTTGGGGTWETITIAPGSSNIGIACSASGQIVYAASTSDGFIYKSTDYGVTWTKLTSSGGIGTFGRISCSSDGNVVCVPTNSKIWTTANAGETWTAGDSPSSTWLSSTIFFNDTTLAAIRANAAPSVYISENNGVTWVSRGGNSGSGALRIKGAATANVLYYTNESATMYKSTDKGVTWTGFGNTSGYSNTGLGCSADGTLYVSGSWVASDNALTIGRSDAGLSYRPPGGSGAYYWVDMSRDGSKVLAGSYPSGALQIGIAQVGSVKPFALVPSGTSRSVATDLSGNVYGIVNIPGIKYSIYKVNSAGTVVWKNETALVPTTRSTITARYIRLQRANSAIFEPINLAEIQIYDSAGAWIQTGLSITYSSAHSTYPPSLMIDGNLTNFGHTNMPPIQNEWVMVDLGSEKVISKVKIVARDGFNARDLGLTMTLRNAAGVTVYCANEIAKPESFYEYTNFATEALTSVTVDGAKNVICTAVANGGTGVGGMDVILYKLDTNGNLLWSRRTSDFNTANDDNYPTVSIDSSDNIYMSFQTTTAGAQRICVVKYLSDGTFQWII